MRPIEQAGEPRTYSEHLLSPLFKKNIGRIWYQYQREVCAGDQIEVSWSQAGAVRVYMGQERVMEGGGERTDCFIKCNVFFLIALLSSNHIFRAALS